jgi:hypothetical protein
MSTRDLLATFGLAAQTGGSPAVITRGITQLIGTSLLHPTRPQSLAAYQQAGLPTTANELAQAGRHECAQEVDRVRRAGRTLEP